MYYTIVQSEDHEGCFLEVYRSLDQIQSRRVIGPAFKCNCPTIIKYGSLCPQQFKVDGGIFQRSRFAQRFHRRMGVSSVPRINVKKSQFETVTDLHVESSNQTAAFS